MVSLVRDVVHGQPQHGGSELRIGMKPHGNSLFLLESIQGKSAIKSSQKGNKWLVKIELQGNGRFLMAMITSFLFQLEIKCLNAEDGKNQSPNYEHLPAHSLMPGRDRHPKSQGTGHIT